MNCGSVSDSNIPNLKREIKPRPILEALEDDAQIRLWLLGLSEEARVYPVEEWKRLVCEAVTAISAVTSDWPAYLKAAALIAALEECYFDTVALRAALR